MKPADATIPDALRLAAFVFAIDRTTAETTAALRAEGIESLVLKGPTTATWLFGNGESRPYTDSDLLIPPREWRRAQEVVAGLGFEDGLGQLAHPRMESGAGYPWKRPVDGAEVDLHCTLFGLTAPPEEVWEALSSTSLVERIGGANVRTPSHPARLLHIAIHATQHGGKRSQSMRDLERALEIVPRRTWAEALTLAERLGGVATFASGLSLTDAGRSLAAEIGLEEEAATDSVRSVLRLEDVPMAEGFADLAEAPGTRAKLGLVVREVFPNPAFMRWWSPLARRGRRGLVAAYCWRIVWLAARAMPGYLAWRRAIRQIRPGA